MFGHLPEFLFIMVIALIVFGPEKLPEVAANAGRWVREAREVLDSAMNPEERREPDDFSSYYYESLARNGEAAPEEDYSRYMEIDGEDAAADFEDLSSVDDISSPETVRPEPSGSHPLEPGEPDASGDAERPRYPDAHL